MAAGSFFLLSYISVILACAQDTPVDTCAFTISQRVSSIGTEDAIVNHSTAPTPTPLFACNFDDATDLGKNTAGTPSTGLHTFYGSHAQTAGKDSVGSISFESFSGAAKFSVGASGHTFSMLWWMDVRQHNQYLHGRSYVFDFRPDGQGGLYFDSDNTMKFSLMYGACYGSTSGWERVFAYTPAFGTWQHFAIVSDPTGTRLFKDGELWHESLASSCGTSSSTIVAGNATLGAYYNSVPGSGSYFLDASIDDLQFYRSALSAQDVHNIYATPATPSPSASPTPTPTASPTPSPTDSPTASPVTVAATGDPHLVNVHGQRFDIFQPGVHPLIRIPQSVRRKTAFLVLAKATRVGDGCNDMYFTEVNISGAWTRRHRRADLTWTAEAVKHEHPKWINFRDLHVKVVRGHTLAGTRFGPDKKGRIGKGGITKSAACSWFRPRRRAHSSIRWRLRRREAPGKPAPCRGAERIIK